MVNADEILRFWFGDADPRATPTPETAARWFGSGPSFDAEVRERFGHLLEAAAEVAAWEGPSGKLAAILVFDQFPRNAHRGAARAFAWDGQALELARGLVDAGLDRELGTSQRTFVYLPFMHAEDRAAQEAGVALYERLAEEVPEMAYNLGFARRHRDIVARFGRFPGRNPALGRPDTAEELAWLEAGGETFGAR